jgi:hypothetical protein
VLKGPSRLAIVCPEKILNFFPQLMNTLGVAVILIGTSGAREILRRELLQFRRSGGQGYLIWDRMANDDVWSRFTVSLAVPIGQDAGAVQTGVSSVTVSGFPGSSLRDWRVDRDLVLLSTRT